MSPMEQKVFNFIEKNQPCSVKDLVIAGFKAATVGNILSKSNLYRRKAISISIKGSRYFVYTINDGSDLDKISEKPTFKRIEIKQHPLMTAFYGMAI